jgi:hypothetical protein
VSALFFVCFLIYTTNPISDFIDRLRKDGKKHEKNDGKEMMRNTLWTNAKKRQSKNSNVCLYYMVYLSVSQAHFFLL